MYTRRKKVWKYVVSPGYRYFTNKSDALQYASKQLSILKRNNRNFSPSAGTVTIEYRVTIETEIVHP